MQYTKKNYEDIPVKIYCPLSEKEEVVFFHAQQIGEIRRVTIDSFNGCDTNYHGCDACENCKTAAYKILESIVK